MVHMKADRHRSHPLSFFLGLVHAVPVVPESNWKAHTHPLKKTCLDLPLKCVQHAVKTVVCIAHCCPSPSNRLYCDH